MKATAKRRPSCQRTMNRVLQYVHVATPNRSTFTGGAPQFGELSAIGPWVPAGTIGPWIGGGGGRFDRWRAPVAARTANTMTMRSTTNKGPRNVNMNALPPKGDAKRIIITKPKTRSNPTTTPTMRRTRSPGARRGGAQYGWGPYGRAPDGAAGPGGDRMGGGDRAPGT